MSKLTLKRVLTVLLMVGCVFMLTACDTSSVENEAYKIFNIALMIAKYVIEVALFVFIVRKIIK